MVISHGGHGTMTRALASGTPALVCPPAGDMAENGARLTWAGAGLAIPDRLLAAAPLRWAARRLLGDPRFAARAEELASWARANHGRRHRRRAGRGARAMSAPLRVIVGAEGMAGHALPALALARGLARRGHDVRFHGRERWRETAEAAGLEFAGEPDDAERGPAAAARALVRRDRRLRAGPGRQRRPLARARAGGRGPRGPQGGAAPRGLSGERGRDAVLLARAAAAAHAAGRRGLARPRARCSGRDCRASAWMRESRAALDAERRELGLGPSRVAARPGGHGADARRHASPARVPARLAGPRPRDRADLPRPAASSRARCPPATTRSWWSRRAR